jgi:acylphosphatase
VWFRDSTRREAESLGIGGYAMNLDNGDVEILGYGTPNALDRLQTWLHKGPPLASVAAVAVEIVAYEGQAEESSGFAIR